jgi:ribosome-associated protein
MTSDELKTRSFENEFNFSASRSSGAGGQNINKVNTKIELRWLVNDSQVLTDEEKLLIHKNLASRINSEGYLYLACQTQRSQLQNKEAAIEKFFLIVAKALTPKKKRKPTSPSATSKAKRLSDKRILSEKKVFRKKIE